MKQIKTVIEPIERADIFDTLINGLLSNGWELKTRKVIKTTGELSDAFNAPDVRYLYAELEQKDFSYFEEVTN